LIRPHPAYEIVNWWKFLPGVPGKPFDKQPHII
jgi:hypothetical protein